MKKIFFYPTLLFVLLLSNLTNAQTVIKPEELSGTFLKETFEDALFTVLETKDDYIKTKSTFDFYVDIDSKKRFVSFSGTFLLVDGVSKQKALELVDKFNQEIIMVKSYYNPSSNSISVYYYFWTEGGFTKQSMLKSFNMMPLAVNLMLNKDEEKIMK